MRGAPLLCFLLVLPLLAGCAAPPKVATPAAVPASAGPATTTTAAPVTVAGRVEDEDAYPIANARVELEQLGFAMDTVTDGKFAFDGVPPGIYNLRFTHPNYETLTKSVSAVAGAPAVEARLMLEPDRRPHSIPYEFKGSYDCAMEVLIIPGDCMILWSNVTHEPDPVTKESTAFFVDVGKGWSQVVVEMTWSTGPANQLDGMHLYLAPANESRDPSAHHTKMAVAEGPKAPLRIDLISGQVHPTAEHFEGSSVRAQLATDGGTLLGLVYPRGQFADEAASVCEPDAPQAHLEADKCFLGVGAGLSVTFTARTTVFYNGAAPAGFTAFPG